MVIPDRDRPIAVTFSVTHLEVTLANGRTLAVPLTDYPALAQATPAQRANAQLGLAGLYWPDLNLDLPLLTLLSGNATTPRSHKPRFCEG